MSAESNEPEVTLPPEVQQKLERFFESLAVTIEALRPLIVESGGGKRE